MNFDYHTEVSCRTIALLGIAIIVAIIIGIGSLADGQEPPSGSQPEDVQGIIFVWRFDDGR